MKIEELKGCFDSITPTKEQRDKMLAGIMSAKEDPVKVVKLNRYKYLSVAAVIALGIFVAVYSYIGKDIVPQVETTDVGQNAGSSTYATAEVPKKTESNITEGVSNKTEDNTVAESADIPQTDATPVSPTEETVDSKEHGTLTEEMQEAYPELGDESVANTPSVAMYDNTDAVRIAPAPEAVEEDYTVDAEDYSGGAGGGGGGGASAGGGAPANNKNISLSYIKNHSVYSVLFPTYFPGNFVFESAEESLYNVGDFNACFTSVDGGFIDMTFEKKYENSYGINVITPEQVKNMNSEAYMDFTIDCGDYWVNYFTKNISTEELYKIVKSSPYFSN